MRPEDEVRGVGSDVAQEQRVGDLAKQGTLRVFDRHAAIRRLRGGQDQLIDLQHADLHLRLEVRGGGELVLQVAQEALHGPGQVRGHRRRG